MNGVFLTDDFLTVSVEQGADWSLVKSNVLMFGLFFTLFPQKAKPSIFSAIMEFYASGKPILEDKPEHPDTVISEEDDEVVQMIKEIIETRIRPAVQDVRVFNKSLWD